VRAHIDTFWGALLGVGDAGAAKTLHNLHPFFDSHAKVDLEDREGGLVNMYFDVIVREWSWQGLVGSCSLRRWDEQLSENPKAVIAWVVLTLRMVCWLNLHTFHAADVQLPKSDLMGTRLPVYIS
jgi:hypothetical protein